jgi:ribosomal protein L14E/L6E/L27E
MVLLEVGRVCIKKYGRDAGSKAVVTGVLKNGFVTVLTAKRSKKERPCNPSHLEFLSEKVDVNDRQAVHKALGITEAARPTQAAQRTQRASQPR